MVADETDGGDDHLWRAPVQQRFHRRPEPLAAAHALALESEVVFRDTCARGYQRRGLAALARVAVVWRGQAVCGEDHAACFASQPLSESFNQQRLIVIAL